ncbi:MAG TPA: hydrolase TatD [Acholeplasmatales bacterium]|nr:hydrolase TatD [Acholeplasmatales bacterium]
MYFDSHVHLNDDLLFNDLENVVAAAEAAGVRRMICVGYDVASSERAIAIAETYKNVYAAVGLHPENAHRMNDADFEAIERMLSHPKVVAVGEIGLDRYWDKTKLEVQIAAFIRQIELADKYHKPICVHMREATMETISVLTAHKPSSMRGVMHCYGGSPESAADFLRLGMFISLAGPVTFKNARVAKAVAAVVPLDRLLIETDAPYLAPDPYRGKRNESKYVPLVAAEIARIKGIAVETVERRTSENASSLFNVDISR